MSTQRNGFTLIELLIGLAIVTILIALAVPAATSARGAVESSAARAALQDGLWRAMRVSQVEQQHVVICSSHDGARCSGSIEWEKGWIAFIDRDRDRAPDPGARLLENRAPFDSAVRISSTPGRTRIVMQPFGGASAGSNVTFTVCDVRGPDSAVTAILANRGRLRTSTPLPGTEVRCP
jgi:type IV fimbrial biogenesis protein FimT